MGRRILGREVLADGAVVAQNATTYTDSMKFDKSTGDVAIELVTTGNMTLTVTQQCSFDNKNWYDPIDGGGTSTGAVATSTTATISDWIVPTLAPAPYIRFKMVEANAAAGTATLKVYSQEDVS